MNPRYEVFISSTFRDLRKERQAALDAVLDLGHFPAGMEVFPAADATPWSMIESIIAESDYYVLIVGGVYGSTDEAGISYTEREYDLAMAKGIPILAFLHGDPSKIPAGMSELEKNARDRLAAFRAKVEIHHCKYWHSADELKAQVVVGLVHAIRVNPRIGWIRADRGDSPETLKKVALLLEENSTLRTEMKTLRDSLATRAEIGGDIASGQDRLEIRFRSKRHLDWKLDLTWDELFLVIGPIVISEISDWNLFQEASRDIALIEAQRRGEKGNLEALTTGAELVQDDFIKIVYQFMALDYIEPVTLTEQRTVFERLQTERYSGYKLTKRGTHKFAHLKAIKRSG